MTQTQKTHEHIERAFAQNPRHQASLAPIREHLRAAVDLVTERLPAGAHRTAVLDHLLTGFLCACAAANPDYKIDIPAAVPSTPPTPPSGDKPAKAKKADPKLN